MRKPLHMFPLPKYFLHAFFMAMVLMPLVGCRVAADNVQEANDVGGHEDIALGITRYTKAAEAGEPSAQYQLGWMYLTGQGVPQDDVQAARWYTSAAEAGHPTAQIKLGWMYAKGRGVTQDDVRAHRWFSIAAAKTDRTETRDHAIRSRDRAARKLSPPEVAEAQKLAREWTPTTHPSPDR